MPKKNEPKVLIEDLEAIATRLRRTAGALEVVVGPTRIVGRIHSDILWLERVIARAKGE